MRNILLGIPIVVLIAAPALAEPSGSRGPDRPINPPKLLPVKPAGGGNPCAAYGPGFVKLAGSDTCVKLGGGIGIGVGGGR